MSVPPWMTYDEFFNGPRQRKPRHFVCPLVPEYCDQTASSYSRVPPKCPVHRDMAMVTVTS